MVFQRRRPAGRFLVLPLPFRSRLIRAILEATETAMPDPTHLFAPKTCTDPTQICEKCRSPYTLDHFQHGIEGQECVCRRCLQVMGYKV
jgi:hypothetical protein